MESYFGILCIICAMVFVKAEDIPALLEGQCAIDGEIFNNGDVTKASPCGECICYDGNEMCPVADCMPPRCVDAVSDPDSCCGWTCPNGENCEAGGTVISADEGLVEELSDGCTVTCKCPLWGTDAQCDIACPPRHLYGDEAKMAKQMRAYLKRE